jgi:carboxypeptidase PM20D1
MAANLRLNPHDSVRGAVMRIRDTIRDGDITLKVLQSFEPSPISRTDCEGWRRISRAVSDTWQGCLVAPYLMVQCSDSRHYRDLSDRVYRFSAMDLTKEERGTIHGNNERIRLETALRAVEFFIRVLKQC